MATALPYEAPTQVVILILISFLVTINVARRIFARIVGAGLLGEIIVGAIYGAPLASILPSSSQQAILSFGYLGLLLLVAGVGVETRLDILTQHLSVVFFTATIGIALPIGFSLALLPPAFGFGVLEAFACGAALASTSLGTVFSVIGSVQSSNQDDDGEESRNASIIDTRAGSVLIGAALLDDIVGLVLSSIVVSLSSSSPSSSSQIAPWIIARPIVSSAVFLLVAAVLARFLVGGALRARNGRLAHTLRGGIVRFSSRYASLWSQYSQETATVVAVAVVAGSTSIAAYIGSSNLIGAFSAGAFMAAAWSQFKGQLSIVENDINLGSDAARSPAATKEDVVSPQRVLGYLEQSLGRFVLVPFFFASIGFAIPVREMFTGEIVWKGFVYSGLMALAKTFAGAPILLADALSKLRQRRARRRMEAKRTQSDPTEASRTKPTEAVLAESSSSHGMVATPAAAEGAAWPAALFVGSALVARGEIGFLIVNLANQGGLLSTEAFLVTTWAITLNTVVGPACVGILLRRKAFAKAVLHGPWGAVSNT